MSKHRAKRVKRSKAKRPRPTASKQRAPRKKSQGATAAKARSRKRTAVTRRSREGSEERGRTVGLLRDIIEHHETGPATTGGDLDADWQRAQSSGEEAVGGSVSTPDQDRVDEIGHALGVEQPAQAPLRTTEEILQDRDRRYWELERRADRKATRRREP